MESHQSIKIKTAMWNSILIYDYVFEILLGSQN